MSASPPLSALSPVQKELYEYAVRQVKAKGLAARSVPTRSVIFRLLFGARELTALDLHNRPEPVRKHIKRAARTA